MTCENGTTMAHVQKNKYVKIDAGYHYVTTECTQTGEWEPELPTCVNDRSKFQLFRLHCNSGNVSRDPSL